MNNNLSINDFNFTDLNSQLLNNLKEENENNLNNVNITIKVNKQDLIDFNNRIITPQNINNIINICDYFLIDNVKEFLIKNSVPTFEKYKIDNYELSNKPKYELPIFMTKGMHKIFYNKLPCLSELFENEEELLVEDIFNNYLSSFTNSVQEMASVNAINWIEFYLKSINYKNKYKFFDVSKYAAFYNNKECLEYLHNNNIEEYNEKTCTAAAYTNNLELLKFLHNNDCPWNNFTCAAAANTGSLECLKYAYENGCNMDWITLSEAARNGHIDCIKYALKKGCQFDSQAPIDYESACTLASATNQLDVYKFCIANNCDPQLSLLTAARYGNSEMVKYIFENHYSTTGNDDDYGVKMVSRCAIKSGDLKTLVYTHQIIKSSLLEKDEVMYAYRNEKEHCTLIAATAESSDVLNYLLENNIKLDKDALKYALTANSEKCVDYILNLPSDINKICLDHKINNYINIAMKSNNLSLVKKMYELFPRNREEKICPIQCYECQNFDCWNFLISKNLKFDVIYIQNYNQQYISRWISNFEYIKLHEKLKIIWDFDLPQLLGYYGQYELLKYVVEKGCRVGYETMENICSNNQFINNSELDYVPNKLACLKYGIENNFEYNLDFCNNCSNKELLKFVLSKNIELDDGVIGSNLDENNIETADLLISLGYKIKLNAIKTAIQYYYYRKYKTSFLETFNNIENQNNIYYKRLIYYLSICSELSNDLFDFILSHSCFELIPELVKLKCPLNKIMLVKFIKTFNQKNHKFLIWLFKLIMENYDIKLTEELLFHSSNVIYPIHFKNFLIENKCEGFEKYANNNNIDFKPDNNLDKETFMTFFNNHLGR